MTFNEKYKNIKKKCIRGCKGRELLYNHVKSTLSRVKNIDTDTVSCDFVDTKGESLIKNSPNEVDNKTLTEKIKSVRERYKSTGIKFKDTYCVENVKVCHRELLDYFRLKSVEIENELLYPIPKKVVKKRVRPKKKVKKTINRKIFDVEDVEETELEQSVKLFQRILHGRAYQTMMLLAQSRYKQFLDNNFTATTAGCNYVRQCTVGKKKKRVESLLERLKERFISNYFDGLTKEFVMKQFNAEWSREFNELVRTRHFVETTETNRRVKEIIARGQTGEKFRQVMEIHSDIAKMLFETVVENACESSAKHVAAKTIEGLIDGYFGNQFVSSHDGDCSDALYSYQPLRLCCSTLMDVNPKGIE